MTNNLCPKQPWIRPTGYVIGNLLESAAKKESDKGNKDSAKTLQSAADATKVLADIIQA